MSFSIKDDRKKLDKIILELEKVSNSYVLVGFQEGTLTRAENKQGRKKKAGLSQAQIAAQNEFGTKDIPARPFMGPTFDEQRGKIERALGHEYDKILAGNSTVKRSLTAIGSFYVDAIKQKIRSIHYPPNSPKTIAIKKSSKPLIDFGQMIQSVTAKVFIP